MGNLKEQESSIDSLIYEKMTYEAFTNLEKNNENQYEYIDGYVYTRASTSTYHSYIKGEVWDEIKQYLKKNIQGYKVFDELRLIKVMKDDDKTKDCIADLAIVCDMKKFMGGKYYGVPTIVVEIVSPSNSSVDFVKKRNAYMEIGVKEYWIIDSRIGEVGEIIAYKIRLNEEDVLYTREDMLESSEFEGLKINLGSIFEDVKEFV